MSNPRTFQDASTDCAICLEPFVTTTDEHHHHVSQNHVTTLGCGHKWHLDCLVQQLQTAQPSSTKRLLFTGCQCAKCGVICDHPDLRDLTRTTDALRQKVDELVKEQVALDAPGVWKQAEKEAESNPESQKAVLEDARRKYAFYLCTHCREPYFGGTVECADQEEREEERLCVACAPQSQISCRNPLEHRGHLLWKCRYCCQPSTHLCYGSVHFCNDCHDRNSQRVRQLQLQRHRQRQRQSSHQPPSLQAIPCRGANCSFPKPDNQTHHSNGSDSNCEQVYVCAWCQSASDHPEPTEESGSHNLLSNPSGQNGVQGWRQLNPRMSWVVEQSELPVNAATTTNFVSSYQPCIMCQTLDLSRILNNPSTATARMEVSARYMGRTDSPSFFRLEVILMDENQRPLQRLATPKLEAPPDYWERASLMLEGVALPEARYLNVTIVGKDGNFWQGTFGSKVAECSLRVLGTPPELAQLLRTEVLQAQQQVRGRRVHPNHNNDDAQRHQRLIFRHALLPLVCFVILAWLLQN
jgi:hypothetical protein